MSEIELRRDLTRLADVVAKVIDALDESKEMRAAKDAFVRAFIAPKYASPYASSDACDASE